MEQIKDRTMGGGTGIVAGSNLPGKGDAKSESKKTPQPVEETTKPIETKEPKKTDAVDTEFKKGMETYKNEHKELNNLIDKFMTGVSTITEPMKIDIQGARTNYIDESGRINELQLNQDLMLQSTKQYIDDLQINSTTAVRLNSVASLGSQIKINYETFMPMQESLESMQENMHFLREQQEAKERLDKLAFFHQQDEMIAQLQRHQQAINLNLQKTKGAMQDEVLKLLSVFNQYTSTANNLVLTKSKVEQQNKAIEAREKAKPTGWQKFGQSFVRALPMMFMAAMAGGKFGGKAGGMGIAKLAGRAAEGSRMARFGAWAASGWGKAAIGGTAALTSAGIAWGITASQQH